MSDDSKVIKVMSVDKEAIKMSSGIRRIVATWERP